MTPYFYIDKSNDVQGPLTIEQLYKMSKAKVIGFDTKVCPQGGTDWVPLYSIPAATAAISGTKQDMVSGKRILPAFLLCFFLGWFGVHAFYSGQKNQGFIYLGLLAFSVFGNLLLPVVATVIAYIAIIVFWFSDLIRLLVGAYRDGDGNKMTEW